MLVQCTGVLEHYYGVFGKLLGAGAAAAFTRGAGLQVFVALVLYRISLLIACSPYGNYLTYNNVDVGLRIIWW